MVKASHLLALVFLFMDTAIAAPALLDDRALHVRCVFGACPPDQTSGGAKMARATVVARDPAPEPCIFGACPPDQTSNDARKARENPRAPEPEAIQERCIFGACPPDQTGGGAKMARATVMAREVGSALTKNFMELDTGRLV
ncbi:hypothetical protein DACRYDRAFT_18526 [Dacryopinax primogenitus]|uniref:Uncharacterized protein n=1 Tax=Dacryopinax primogenitus (strain DJM 731) TaxID=1858805 RepID=M5FNJ0_DACPD|nr:uncharacterized protein DACRYDRAFT_18526 [Dacryopinax primogenitus]EJT97530.1 hypothetical protein DACRYDRAFT_18526 [Dacryopinax primogenitus]